ncbi:MAG: CopD family protein [Pseudonocardia sp.]|nr:CopD family protein [Pseudonocardia sp.]
MSRADRLLPAAGVALAAGAAALACAVVTARTTGVAALATGIAVTRAGADVLGVACVGLALVAVLLPAGTGSPGDVARVHTSVDRGLLGLGGAWALMVLLGITLRSADAFGRPLGQLGTTEVLRWSTQLAAGRGLVLAAACAAVVVGCAAARLHDPQRVPARVVLVAALLGVLTPAVTGHAGSAPDHQLAVVTVALHAGAAAVWVGGLAGLVVLVARRPLLLRAALPRFSLIAGVCVGTVAVTGVLAAQIQLQSWGALLATGYGQLVVAKAAALVLLTGLGGLARRRLAAGRSPVLRWAGYEVALMAVTLGLAATLSQTAPGITTGTPPAVAATPR